MRDYAQIVPTFWTRGSGKQLRGDPLAMLIALYAMTCPSSTMVGIYYLPIPTLAHETGSTVEGAREALRRVEEVGIAYYDDETEMIWVPEMARYQIGETLTPRDNRKAAVIRALRQVGKHRFARAFHEKYREAYGLPDMPELGFEEPETKGPRSPFEAPSDPLRSQRTGTENREQDLSHTLSAAAREDGPGEAEEPPASVTVVRPGGSPAPVASKGEPSSPEARRLLEAIRSHEAIRAAAMPEVATALEGRRMMRGTPVEVLVEAIGECAREAAMQAASGAPWDVTRIASQLGRYCDTAAKAWTSRPRDDRQRPRGDRPAGLPPVQPMAKPGQYDWRKEADERRAQRLRALEAEADELPLAIGGGNP